MLDNTVFKKGMAMMCVVANREPSEVLLSTYYALLKDLSDEQFQSAVTHVLSDRQYTNLPIPANIREAAIGKVDDEAIIALDKLERSMSTYGAYRSIAFDDPIIHPIVKSMGGWPAVCRMPLDEWKFRRQEFLKVYKAFAPNLNRLQIPDRLVGVDEANNTPLANPVVYIGGEQKVREWQAKIGCMKTLEGPCSVTDVAKLIMLPEA